MARYQTEVKRLYEVLEKRLAHSPYLGGAEYYQRLHGFFLTKIVNS